MIHPAVDLDAVAVGAALLGISLLPGLPWRGRALAPLVALLLLAALVFGLGMNPAHASEWRAWALAMPTLDGARLFAWTAVAVLAARLPCSAGPGTALLCGATVGALPAAAIVTPRAPDGFTAVRWAMLAVAGSVLTPLGGPAQLLVAGDPSRWFQAALAPAAALAALAWPWRRAPLQGASVTAVPWPVVATLPGALLSWVSVDAGLALAAAGVVALRAVLVGFGAPSTRAEPGSAVATWTLGWAAVAAFAAAVAHLGGVTWWLGRVLMGDIAPHVRVEWLMLGAGLAVGSADPALPALVMSGAVEVANAPIDALPAAVGIALAPGGIVLVAVARHGARALLAAAVAVPVAIALLAGWVALTT